MKSEVILLVKELHKVAERKNVTQTQRQSKQKIHSLQFLKKASNLGSEAMSVLMSESITLKVLVLKKADL
jgi:hypothetical protein